MKKNDGNGLKGFPREVEVRRIDDREVRHDILQAYGQKCFLIDVTNYYNIDNNILP